MKLDPNSLISRELRHALRDLVDRYEQQWMPDATHHERTKYEAKREFALDLIAVLESVDDSI